MWAIIGFVVWHLFAHSYEGFLGGVAWDFFPQEEVFLALEDHIFSIGLRVVDETTIPQLTLISHNFGFGLVITASVILGARGRSWALRVMGLCCVWVILMLTQTMVLVAAAHTYQMAATQPEVPLSFSMFIKSVHPTVTVLPISFILMWFVSTSDLHLARTAQR